MTQADDSERSGCKPDPNAPKPVTNMGAMIACKNTTMAELAQNLQQMANAYIDHPIVDATGLEGGWDFLIGWTPKACLQAQQRSESESDARSDRPRRRIPTASRFSRQFEKELGLKLVKQKRSIPVIVVDHVTEKPVE